MKLQFYQQVIEKYSNIKFHEYPSIGSRVARCGQIETTKLFARLLTRVKRQEYNLNSIYCSYKLWNTPPFREITRYADIAIWQGAALWNETRIALNLHGYQGGYRGDCDLRREYRSLARTVRMLLSTGHTRVLARASLRTTTVVCPWYPWIRASDQCWTAGFNNR